MKLYHASTWSHAAHADRLFYEMKHSAEIEYWEHTWLIEWKYMLYEYQHARNSLTVLSIGNAGPKGLVCYYYGPKSTVYEELGHAEVVQVQLDPEKAQKEMHKFADVRAHPLLPYNSSCPNCGCIPLINAAAVLELRRVATDYLHATSTKHLYHVLTGMIFVNVRHIESLWGSDTHMGLLGVTRCTSASSGRHPLGC